MSLNKFLRKIDFSVEEHELREMRKQIDDFIDQLRESVKRNRIDAEICLGGSFAKGTVATSARYDADIFVRFDWKYEDLSAYLEKILRNFVRDVNRVHGSRDYFRVRHSEKLIFEVIPVLRIKKVREARNVTDLSYFHINFVKRNLKGNMKRELAIAKKFCQAQGFYGAESYIQGFSGYGLECLIIHYKTFEAMLKDLIKIKEERKIIDIKKFYKQKQEVFFSLNESKMHSPIVLIDPTWKERNVLASLSWETFRKFQEKAREFMAKPKKKYFEFSKSRGEEISKIAKKKRMDFLQIVLETDRQEGDIAGTKMKKFSEYLSRTLKVYFELADREFYYSRGQKADFFVALKAKKETVRLGPPLDRKKDVARFEKLNKGKTFRKNGQVYRRDKIDFDARTFLNKWIKSKEGRKKMSEMGIVSLKLIKFS